MQVLVEQEVMEAAAEQGVQEGGLLLEMQNQERGVQEVLAVLGEAEAAAEVLVWLEVLQQEVMLVMVGQEVMVEVEAEAAVKARMQVLVAAALVALD